MKRDNMDDILQINGKSYYSKNMVDREINRQIRSRLIKTGNFTDKFINSVLEPENKGKHYGRGHPRPQSAKLEFNSNSKQLYKPIDVDSSGIIKHRVGTYDWNINDLYYIKKNISSDMTYKDANDIAKFLELSLQTVSRLIWNLNTGVFDKTFQEYENKLYGRKKLPLENNPQKRKENGYL